MTHDEIEQALLHIRRGEAVLIDVRTFEERTLHMSPHSQHLDLQDIEAGILPDLSKDTKIYVHCRSGVRSERASTLLRQAGFKSVSNLGPVPD